MLTEKQLAEYEAEKYWGKKTFGDEDDYGYSRLGHEIDSIIGNETRDFKLHFLNQLQSLVSLSLDYHLETCKEKTEPQNCPEIFFYYKTRRYLSNKRDEMMSAYPDNRGIIWPFDSFFNSKTFKFSELKITETISVVTVIIVLLGFFKVYNYYRSFSIDITAYLEGSEIIFSFSTLFVQIIFLLNLVVLTNISKWLKDILAERVDSKIKESSVYLGFAVLFGLIYSVAIEFNFSQFDFIELALLMILILVILVLDVISVKVPQGIIIWFSLFFFILLIQLEGRRSVNAIIKDRAHNYEISFKYKDEIIGTNDSIFFIGSTRNYIFLWDANRKKSTSYTKNDISWITMEGK